MPAKLTRTGRIELRKAREWFDICLRHREKLLGEASGELPLDGMSVRCHEIEAHRASCHAFSCSAKAFGITAQGRASYQIGAVA